jgi:hypothetical protein
MPAGGGEAAIRGDGRRPHLPPLGNHRRPAHIRYVRQAALHVRKKKGCRGRGSPCAKMLPAWGKGDGAGSTNTTQ